MYHVVIAAGVQRKGRAAGALPERVAAVGASAAAVAAEWSSAVLGYLCSIRSRFVLTALT